MALIKKLQVGKRYLKDGALSLTPQTPEPTPLSAEASQEAMRQWVLDQDLTIEDRLEYLVAYEKWEPGIDYAKDTEIRHGMKLYKTLQAHTSQSDWAPDVAVSLFARIVPEGVIEPWEQRGTLNPCMIGDKVTWEGHIWESVIDSNVWSPTAYPSGWNDLGPIEG